MYFKDSGIDWIGRIPNEWRSFRIKDVAQLSPGFSSKAPPLTELCTVVPMEAVSEKGQMDTSTVEEYDLISNGLPNFEVGDAIFAKITPCMENGKGAYVKSLPTRYAFGSTEFHVLRPGFKVDGRFLYYCTYNPVYREYAEVNMTGAAGQKRVSSRFLNYTRIFLPAVPEQHCIASFLDKTCAAIDAAIEKKQKQLETLDALRKSIIHKAVTRGLDDSVALKDSGVEWIEMIPKHWQPFRIKDVAKLSPGFSNAVPNPKEMCTVVPMEAVSEKGQIDTSAIEEYELITSGLTNFEAGDVIFAKITPCMENGKGAYVVTIPTKYAFGSTEFHVLRPMYKVVGKFLYYYTYNSVFRSYAALNMTGAAGQKRVSSRFLNYTRMHLPQRDEQQQIVDYLDNKIAGLVALQANLSSQLFNLEQYRKSLIHECVTGKRRITEEDMRVVQQY